MVDELDAEVGTVRACCYARNIERMGQKVDREAVATFVLPRLWKMSMVHVNFSLNIRRFLLIFLRSAKYRSVCTLHEVRLLYIF